MKITQEDEGYVRHFSAYDDESSDHPRLTVGGSPNSVLIDFSNVKGRGNILLDLKTWDALVAHVEADRVYYEELNKEEA